jgi:hypothetical protein
MRPDRPNPAPSPANPNPALASPGLGDHTDTTPPWLFSLFFAAR